MKRDAAACSAAMASRVRRRACPFFFVRAANSYLFGDAQVSLRKSQLAQKSTNGAGPSTTGG